VTITPYSQPTPCGVRRGYRWECECGESGERAELPPQYWADTLPKVRQAANEHASKCRALPPTATR